MIKKKLIRAMALLLGGAVGIACVPSLAGCKTKKDSIVLMTEELSGLFNPFYATSGTDQDVVSMTQIGMLTYDADERGNVTVAAGDEYAVACKAYDIDTSSDTETVYTFVIKNGLKFSDGVPLTVNDVIFNFYEYLDPVYTGSSTMYSVKIKGLSKYRTQTNSSAGGTTEEELISKTAYARANDRKQELIDIFMDKGYKNDNSYSRTEAEMKNDISTWEVSEGYKNAIATESKQAEIGSDESYYRTQLVKDYEFVLETFKKELQSDFNAAKDSFDLNTLPYSEHKAKLANDVFKFLLYEGYITPNYEKVQGKENKEKILSFNNENYLNTLDTEEKAIQRVYSDTVTAELHNILTGWGTAGTVRDEFVGTATEVVIKENLGDSATLAFPNIEGIVSLGHTTNQSSVTIKGVTYNVAHSHNEDGTPVNANEYDVVQVTVEGKDPKAIYNFGFSVTPVHYYTADAAHPNGREVDIANNKFGVEYASSDFQSSTIKSLAHVEVPVGAGAYMATNRNNGDNPTGNDFVSGNIVYYKANPYFMFDVKTEKLRMQVVQPSDALDVLESGAVDYVSPQFTEDNSRTLTAMENRGFVRMDAWQLGYGYIGINAAKVPDINIRRALMAAMDTSLALGYYDTGTCKNINWPMSMMSWAYPYEAGTNTAPGEGTSKQNDHDYTQYTNETLAKTTIKKYMDAAGVSAGDSRLKITFTIAGASITEHPTYAVFTKASELLTDLGWEITVRADTQALTKISTGSLQVWAAAWGSTIDPDLYQVYHKNSSATSVKAWGYPEILAQDSYYRERDIIDDLSEIIDDARETMDQNARIPLYEEAMRLILDLAVELPVYQRKNLYAYNGKTVTGFPATVNAYTSPLEKVWELEIVK